MRNSSSRPDHYQINKCVEMLRKFPYLGVDLPSMLNDVESVVRKTKCSKVRDAPRMVNVILELQEEYLRRDKNHNSRRPRHWGD